MMKTNKDVIEYMVENGNIDDMIYHLENRMIQISMLWGDDDEPDTDHIITLKELKEYRNNMRKQGDE